MALSEGRVSQGLHADLIQPRYLLEDDRGRGQALLQHFDPSLIESFCSRSNHDIKAMFEVPASGSSDPLADYPVSSLPPSFSEPINPSGGGGFMFSAISCRATEPSSVLCFTPASDYSHGGSMLCFEQEPQNDNLKAYGEGPQFWPVDSFFHSREQHHHLHSKSNANGSRLHQGSGFTTDHAAVDDAPMEDRSEEELAGWLYLEERRDDIIQSSAAGLDREAQKRPFMVDDAPSPKRHCSAENRKKTKCVASKDTQSVAAKNRRERISERLRVLQGLVPNGTKVDLVTMLEKAISYVKFLQLQVKVLSTDEFWPANGGKAPEIAQVKEAIDAILSSHRPRDFGSQ